MKKTGATLETVILAPCTRTSVNLVGMTKDMSQHLIDVAYKDWDYFHRKIFMLVLSYVDWESERKNSNVIIINNSDAIEKLERQFNGCERHMGQVLVDALNFMVKHSSITIKDPVTRKWYTGNLVYSAHGDSVHTTVVLNPDFMPHFESLWDARSFLLMKTPDLMSFSSKFSFPFYQTLRAFGSCDGSVTKIDFTTHQLKDLFGLSKEDYVRKDGKFNRSMFEKRVLIPTLEEINKTELIDILPDADTELLFSKSKTRGRVEKYTVCYKQYSALSDSEKSSAEKDEKENTYGI